MNKYLTYSFAIFLLLISGISEACRPRYFTVEERIANAGSIFLGQVTGVHQDAMERSLERGDESVTMFGPELDYTLRVFVTRTLKGKTEKVTSPAIYSCGNGGAWLGDSVVVFVNANGDVYVSTDKELIASVEEILGK